MISKVFTMCQVAKTTIRFTSLKREENSFHWF